MNELLMSIIGWGVSIIGIGLMVFLWRFRKRMWANILLALLMSVAGTTIVLSSIYPHYPNNWPFLLGMNLIGWFVAAVIFLLIVKVKPFQSTMFGERLDFSRPEEPKIIFEAIDTPTTLSEAINGEDREYFTNNFMDDVASLTIIDPLPSHNRQTGNIERRKNWIEKVSVERIQELLEPIVEEQDEGKGVVCAQCGSCNKSDSIFCSCCGKELDLEEDMIIWLKEKY